MRDAFEEVVVRASGHLFTGWQEVNVTRGADEAALAFGLKATNPAWAAAAELLRRTPTIEIVASGTLVLRGVVDDYASDWVVSDVESLNREVRVSGRSRAADMIDAPPARHRSGHVPPGRTLLQVAQEFDEFGVGFSADIPLRPLPRIHVVPGAPAYAVVEHWARIEGVLPAGQPDGSVRLTRAGRQRHGGALVEGLRGLRGFKVQDKRSSRRSPVVARGQRATGRRRPEETQQEEQVFDPEVGRYRPLIVFPEGEVGRRELRRRAEHERNRAAAAGVTLSVEWAGWRAPDGLLWDPPRLVRVTFPSEEIDGDYALKRVVFKQDFNEGGGTRSELTLVDPRALGGRRAASRGRRDARQGVDEMDTE